jgi:hypothetical protein
MWTTVRNVSGSFDYPRMTHSRLPADRLLTDFFALHSADKRGASLARVRRVEAALRACLESEGSRILVAHDLEMLEAERQFSRTGAVARIAHGDDLIFVLSVFVEPRYLLVDVDDRRAQLSATKHLVEYLLTRCRLGARELSCPLLDIDYRLAESRRGLAARDPATSTDS